MDYDVEKKIATLGYIDGIVEILKIEFVPENDGNFYIMTPWMRVMQRENINCVSIISDSNCPYIAFVSESNFSGINYEKRSGPFAKIKI